MEPTRFDELTKKLASSTSRRQALKAATVAAVGGVLGWRATGTAYAAGGNSACAHFCAAVFGADTTAAGQCTSDAAHGTGLCYTCGPASTGGTKPICCTHTGNGYCASYSGAACCSSSQTCSNGTCVTPTTTTSTTTTSTTAAPTTTTTAAPTTTTTSGPQMCQANCLCNDGTTQTAGPIASDCNSLNFTATCTNFCSSHGGLTVAGCACFS